MSDASSRITSTSGSSTSASARRTRRRARLRGRHREWLTFCALDILAGLVSLCGNLESSGEGGTDGSRRTKSRHRDLYPLPFGCGASLDQVAYELPRGPMSRLALLVDGSAHALNDLHAGKKCIAPRHSLNAAQSAAVAGLADRWLRLARHLGPQLGDQLTDADAFRALVDKGAGGRAVPMRAGLIGSLEACSQVDASGFLSHGELSAISSPGAFFIDGSGVDLASTATLTGCTRKEYVMAIRRQCRSGKVTLSDGCSHCASVFAVAKADGTSQREVWDGGDLSRAAVRPLAPPWLCSPSDLTLLEASDDAPLVGSTRDGASFFDQLALPHWLHKFVAKPPLSVSELTSAEIHADDLPGSEPLSMDEVAAFCEASPAQTHGGSTFLWPLSTCWPMGASWASLVAQRVMTATVIEAGAGEDTLLHARGRPPPDGAMAVSVATDDVIGYERRSSPDVVPGTICPFFAALDQVWMRHGIVGKASKRTDRATTWDSLGMAFVEGTHLLPKAARLRKVVGALTHLLTVRRADPKSFGRFFGTLQWTLLMNRPLLAPLGAAYKFIDHDDGVARRLPEPALQDLRYVSCLLFGLVVDLRAGWTPFFCCTDGAEDYGYGGVEAHCSPETVRKFASHARSWPHFFYPSDTPISTIDSCSPGAGYRLPVASRSFHTTFSVQSGRGFHASKLEYGALCMALHGVARRPRWHRSRTVALVDAHAVLHAAAKGRSGSGNFWHASRALSSLLLGADIQLHIGYIPGVYNPADAPSRGRAHLRPFPRRRARSCTAPRAHRGGGIRRYRELVRSLRRLKECNDLTGCFGSSVPTSSWCSSDSRSLTTQPAW